MSSSTDSITIQTLPVYGVTYHGFSVLCINPRFKLAEMLNASVRAADPVHPWSLQLAYPPEGSAAAPSDVPQTQESDEPLFDFSWNFEDSDYDDDNAEGVVIRNND